MLADVCNSLLLDTEDFLKPMQVAFQQQEKYNYKKMMECVGAAKKWAEKSAFEAYQTDEADLFAQDSDWWYSLVRLVEDRTGDNVVKTKQVLNWLIGMPTELNVFPKLKMSDFKRAKYDVEEPDTVTTDK